MGSTKLKPILLSVMLLLGFSTLVMFALIQLAQRYTLLYNCSCGYALPMIIIFLSGIGIVVGVLTYYFLSGSFERKKRLFNENRKYLINLLYDDEKLIIETLLKHKGELSQSSLTKKSGLDRVKVFRILERLEQKNIIVKQKNKKNNLILISAELKYLLL